MLQRLLLFTAVALSSTGVSCASVGSKTYTVLESEIKDLHSMIERLKDQSNEQDKRIQNLEGLVGHEEDEKTHSRNKRGNLFIYSVLRSG